MQTDQFSPNQNTNIERNLTSLLEVHHRGLPETNIAAHIRDIIVDAGLAGRDEITMEEHPAGHDARRVDIYVRNTFIEVKKDITSGNTISSAHLAQLDGYLEAAAADGKGVQNGILTDGKLWLERNVGDRHHAMKVAARNHREFDQPSQAVRLKEWLDSIIDRQETDLVPNAANLSKYLGEGSPVFRMANQLLTQAYESDRDAPTVEVKRRLWQDLLQVALGRDAAQAGDESDWLFIRHTYITSLVAVIMQQQLLGDIVRYAEDHPDALLKGRILAEQSGLHGVIDADLFTWPTEIDQNEYLRAIARQVERFDWEDNPREVAPILYQNVISQEERDRLSEYYTPRWLAQEITNALIDDPLNQRVLDPACGSGTFIETAVERIRDHACNLSPTETLRKMQENVAGIDINPVAVQLAKATWVMAAADTIRAAFANQDERSVVVPVYLGDSMQLRYDTGTLVATDDITLDTGESDPGEGDTVVFRIPKSLARDSAQFDRLIFDLADAIDQGHDTSRVVHRYDLDEATRASVIDMADSMRRLHQADRNHVWAYYIRNMTRPAVIADDKVDVIIGNPPWLTYGQSADIIREELRSMSEDRYQIWAGGNFAPHQELATLFYTRCAELYAHAGTDVGMVMPHSALRTGQHRKWRTGSYKEKGRGRTIQNALDFQTKEPWDLVPILITGENSRSRLGKPIQDWA